MSRGVEIIAHRGASADAPENTMAAFRLAWEQCAHAIELDVHLSKDGRLAAIHDEDTKRTTGVPGKVSAQTAKALAALDAGEWKHSRWRGEPVPMLANVLAAVPEGRRAFVEIKAGELATVNALALELAQCGLAREQIVLMSLDFDAVKLLRERFAEAEIGWVVDRPWKSPKLGKILERSSALGLQHLCFSRKWPLDAEMVRSVHVAGFMVHAWTVDDLKEARLLAAAGVDGIITNVPGKMIQDLMQLDQ